MTFRFAEPGFLYLLALVPLAFWRHGKHRRSIPMSDIAMLDIPHAPSLRLRCRGLPDILRFVWLSFLVIAMARPQSALPASALHDPGPAVFLLLDISGSMGTVETVTRDSPVTRLEEAKQIARRLVEENEPGAHSHGRVGVIAIAALPRIIVPLTTDRGIVEAEIRSLEVDRLENRTNLGDAIALAIDRLLKGAAIPGAIVLITDGGHNVPTGLSPAEAARIADVLGIPVHAISIGSSATTTSPEEFARDRAALEKIAEITGGTFHRADRLTDVSPVADLVLSGLATEPRVLGYRDWRDRFPEVLLVALMIWCVETVLRARWFQVVA